MLLQNLSAHHTSPKLRPLIDFVAERTDFSALATLRVVDTKDPTSKMGGLASKHGPPGPLSLVAPSLVQLQVGRTATYPRVTRHVDEVGDIDLRSWDEEFVLVLAHEAAHIDQFWNETFQNEHAAEVDAERRAKRILQQYRRAKTGRRR